MIKITIDIEYISKLEDKILCNATELFDESQILLKSKRYARAYFLSQICNEELAKIFILSKAWNDIIYGKSLNFKELEKRLSSHIIKNREILWFDKIFIAKDYSYVNNADYVLEFSKSLNSIKNASLYTCMNEKEVATPSEVMITSYVENFCEATSIRLDIIKSLVSHLKQNQLKDNEQYKKKLEELYSIFNENTKY